MKGLARLRMDQAAEVSAATKSSYDAAKASQKDGQAYLREQEEEVDAAAQSQVGKMRATEDSVVTESACRAVVQFVQVGNAGTPRLYQFLLHHFGCASAVQSVSYTVIAFTSVSGTL